MLAEYLLDLLESCVYLSFGVGGHEAETDQSVVRGNGGRHHWVDKYTLFKQVAGHCEGLEVVADEQGDDRRGSVAYLAAHGAESLEGLVGELPELLLTLRFLLHDVDGLEGCGGGSGGDGGGEDIGA